MELYYKDLISEDASLEKLVDDLMLVVQGAEEIAQIAGVPLEDTEKAELRTRLEQLKSGYQYLRKQAVAGAEAADQLMRRHPYSVAGAAFLAGLLVASLVRRKR